MAENATGSAGFRGAERVQGYSEAIGAEEDDPSVSRPAAETDLVPQMGDNTNNAQVPSSEQLLARLSGGGEGEELAMIVRGSQAAEREEDAAAPAAGPGDLRLRNRERPADVPSLGWNKFLRTLGLKPKPNAAELAAADLGRARSLIRLSTWPRSVGILVANPKGGVGKTPLSLLTAGVLANIRGGGTIVLEVSDDPGALAVRAEGPAVAGVAELLRDMDEIRGAGQLAGYVAQQTSYAAVIGTAGDREALSGEDVKRMAALTDTYYPVRVMDSGNQPSSDAFHGALEVTDVLVIPVLDALPELNGAMQLLRHLHKLDGRAADLARSAIIVRMHDGRTEDPEVRSYADQLVETAGVGAVVHVPFDPHIAQRTTLSFGQLKPATTAAITQLTAVIVSQLNAALRKAE